MKKVVEELRDVRSNRTRLATHIDRTSSGKVRTRWNVRPRARVPPRIVSRIRCRRTIWRATRNLPTRSAVRYASVKAMVYALGFAEF